MVVTIDLVVWFLSVMASNTVSRGVSQAEVMNLVVQSVSIAYLSTQSGVKAWKREKYLLLPAKEQVRITGGYNCQSFIKEYGYGERLRI